jgi:hypothetical protein
VNLPETGVRTGAYADDAVIITESHPSAIPAGAELDIAFPSSGTGHTAKLRPAAAQASPPEPSGLPSGNQGLRRASGLDQAYPQRPA